MCMRLTRGSHDGCALYWCVKVLRKSKSSKAHRAKMLWMARETELKHKFGGQEDLASRPIPDWTELEEQHFSGQGRQVEAPVQLLACEWKDEYAWGESISAFEKRRSKFLTATVLKDKMRMEKAISMAPAFSETVDAEAAKAQEASNLLSPRMLSSV